MTPFISPKPVLHFTRKPCPFEPSSYPSFSQQPFYETPGSSGVDLQAWISDHCVIRPQERLLIPTGLSVEIPEGYEGQVRSRSGLSLQRGLVVLNSPGTIDADYRGEIKVILYNAGSEETLITPAMRIAQFVVCPVVQCLWEEKTILGTTERGEGGFGSTGV